MESNLQRLPGPGAVEFAAAFFRQGPTALEVPHIAHQGSSMALIEEEEAIVNLSPQAGPAIRTKDGDRGLFTHCYAPRAR